MGWPGAWASMAMSAKAARVGRSSGPEVPEQCSRTCQTSWLSSASSGNPWCSTQSAQAMAALCRLGSLADLHRRREARLGDAFSSRAVSALSSMSSGTGSPCHRARSLLWPVVSGWGSHAALTFKVGLGLCCRLRRCGVHNLLTRSTTHRGAPPPPKGRIGTSGCCLASVHCLRVEAQSLPLARLCDRRLLWLAARELLCCPISSALWSETGQPRGRRVSFWSAWTEVRRLGVVTSHAEPETIMLGKTDSVEPLKPAVAGGGTGPGQGEG